MKEDDLRDLSGDCIRDGPQSAMEKLFIEEYLQRKGYTLADLKNLPKQQAKELMTGACRYASMKLAQVESTARFRENIRWPL